MKNNSTACARQALMVAATAALWAALGAGGVVLASKAERDGAAWYALHRPHGRLALSPAIFNFGAVPSRHTLECRFVARNVGVAALALLGAHGGWGCTTAVVGPTTLQPGQRAQIRVAIDPRGQPEEMRKPVTVLTDDPGHAEQTVWVAARLPSENQTPQQLAEVIFHGKCAACHVVPGAGKTGMALYQAVCSMCHEVQPSGLLDARRPREWGGDWPALRHTTCAGLAGTPMPPFQKGLGGPLSRAQIESLRALLRR